LPKNALGIFLQIKPNLGGSSNNIYLTFNKTTDSANVTSKVTLCTGIYNTEIMTKDFLQEFGILCKNLTFLQAGREFLAEKRFSPKIREKIFDARTVDLYQSNNQSELEGV
jgi:hypothetical protein